MNRTDIPELLLERLTRYAAIDTQSNMEKADSLVFPSTDTQIQFAREIAEELRSIGVPDVMVDENSYVIARIPASPGKEDTPSFGLCAHLDTASDAPGSGVKPRIHRNWSGESIVLQNGFILDPAVDKALGECIGHTIITSDGTTLLGADDKAGLSGIMTLAQYLIAHPEILHGPVEILFSPDEETGHGMDKVPLSLLRSKAFYTVDGGHAGEIEAECFNAWKAEVSFSGIAAHLGSAKGRMVNALAMAAAFVNALPARESPETTEGYEGYFCPLDIRGSTEKTDLLVFIRDFDREQMTRRLERLDIIARSIEASFPGGMVTIKKTCQYLNMKQKLDEHPLILERLCTAVVRAGLEPVQKPIRGGTDGSRLTEMGIPTPNIFTGGHNYHSRTEWASLEHMTQMFDTLVELTHIWGE